MKRPASWSSGQGLCLLIMRSRVRFLVLPWEFFLAGKDSRGDHGRVVSIFRLKAPLGISSSCISPLTSSGQRSRASWASQLQKSATLSPQPGGKPRSSSEHVVAWGGRKKHSAAQTTVMGVKYAGCRTDWERYRHISTVRSMYEIRKRKKKLAKGLQRCEPNSIY